MSTQAQKRASIKYDALNTTRLYIRLNNKTDSDILEHLDQIENKQGYVKDLIRKDMKRPVK